MAQGFRAGHPKPHSAVFTSERLLLTSVRSVEDFDEKPGTRVHSFAAEGRGKPA